MCVIEYNRLVAFTASHHSALGAGSSLVKFGITVQTAGHEDDGSDVGSLRPRGANCHAELHARDCFMLLATRTCAQPQQ